MSKDFIARLVLTSVLVLFTRTVIAEMNDNAPVCKYDRDNYVEYNTETKEHKWVFEGKEVSGEGFEKGKVAKLTEGYRQHGTLKSQKSMVTISATSEICKL